MSNRTPRINHKQRGIFNLASGLRCKPGDLALLLSAHLENMGLIVEVVSVGGFSETEGFLWDVKSTGRKIKVVTMDDQPQGYAFECVVADNRLLPISGAPINDSGVAQLPAGVSHG